MSEKELSFWVRRWRTWLSAKRRMVWSLLFLLLLGGITPIGLKWLLVQQLQHALKREVTVQAVQINPLALSLTVQGLAIKNPQGGEFVGWQRLTVDVSAQSFTQGAWVLDALTLQSPRVSVAHLGQGRFDFSDLLDGPKEESATTLPPFVVREVSIHDGRMRLDDQPFQRTHTIENFKLLLPQVSSVAGHNGLTLRPELSALINETPVHMAGEVQPLADAPHAALALTLNALDVAALQAYMPDTLPMRLAGGKLSADLKLQFGEVDRRTSLVVNGTTQLQEVVLSDAHDQALLSFKTLAITLSPSDVLARHVLISNITLEEPKAAVRIQSDGQLNWMAALPPSTPIESSKPSSDNTAFSVQVDQFTLRSGALDFVDASVKPAVQTRITDMNAVMKNISTQPNAQVDVALKANLGSAAPLNVQARLKPLDVTSFLDAKLQTKNVDLTRFSGYAQKYLGYPLNKGRLSIDARYQIKDKQLEADNHVVIDHLTLGEQVQSPYAVDSPVALGVSLLKNSSGQIDIELPVSGAVDAPDFSFGGLIAQTIGNILIKVVTAPVRAIGNTVNGDDNDD